MNAYDRQLQSAIEHLDTMNPMFDFDGADRATQARQLKTWWGRPLADDHLHGHDPSGPIAVPEAQLTDRQLVLLSALQRGARGTTGAWAMAAEPADQDGLSLTVAGHGLAVAVRLGEGPNGIMIRGFDNAAGGWPSAWIPELLYQTGYVGNPAADLVDLLALSAAFDASPLSGLAFITSRLSYDTLEVQEEEIPVDWRSRTAAPGQDALIALAAAAGMTGEEAQATLDMVLHTAVEHGHSAPEAPAQAATAPEPGHRAGHSSAGAAILAGMGIDVGNATVIAIPPGGSMSIGIGAGAGGLSVTEHQTSVGATSSDDPEDAFMAECAASLGIPLETFRDIVQGDEEPEDDEQDA